MNGRVVVIAWAVCCSAIMLFVWTAAFGASLNRFWAWSKAYDGAAWVQGGSSLIAIGIAIAIPTWQQRRQRHEDRRRTYSHQRAGLELMLQHVSMLRANALSCRRGRPGTRMVMEITAARMASFPLHLIEDAVLTRLFIGAEANVVTAVTLHDHTLTTGLWTALAPAADQLLNDAAAETDAFAQRLEQLDPG